MGLPQNEYILIHFVTVLSNFIRKVDRTVNICLTIKRELYNGSYQYAI